VVTQPDRPAGRGHKLTPTPVKRAAEARGLRISTPERLKPFADEARALGADAFVVASYGRIVPQALLDVVPIAFNVHPSLLPLYRGATPLQSAIRDGRTETGVTIIAMDAGMDTGDVLLQERTPIGPEETYGELHDRLAQRGAKMVVEALQRYEEGCIKRRSQNEIAYELEITGEEIVRTLTRPLRKEDLVISGDLKAKEIVDKIRSLAPAPAARMKSSMSFAGPVKVLKASVSSDAPLLPSGVIDPGQPVLVRGRIWIEARDGMVRVDELVVPGSKPMSANQFKIGYPGLTGPEYLLPYLRRYLETSP